MPTGAPSHGAATAAATAGWPRAASHAETSTARRLRPADPRAPPLPALTATTPAGDPASRPTSQPRTGPTAPRPPAPHRQHRGAAGRVAAAYWRPDAAATRPRWPPRAHR